MEQPWEHGEEKTTRPGRQWVVEYEVDNGDGVVNAHISVLCGWDVTDVQTNLFTELRQLYPDSERLDVTITRLEPVSTKTNLRHFDPEGLFAP